MRLPEEAAARAEAGEEFATSEALSGSLAQWLPRSMTRREEHFIFILIKLWGEAAYPGRGSALGSLGSEDGEKARHKPAFGCC